MNEDYEGGEDSYLDASYEDRYDTGFSADEWYGSDSECMGNWDFCDECDNIDCEGCN